MSHEAQRDVAEAPRSAKTAPRSAETAPLEYRQAVGNEITSQGLYSAQKEQEGKYGRPVTVCK